MKNSHYGCPADHCDIIALEFNETGNKLVGVMSCDHDEKPYQIRVCEIITASD